MTQQPDVEQEQIVDVGQGSDVYLESLNANGVNYVFINSGTDTFPIQESIAKYQSQGRRVPEVILCLDEEVAMSAAHGYYMVSGKPQVLLVHVDAGTMQVGGAIHNAQRGRAGMVFCAGRAPYTFEGELPGGKSMNIHWLQEQIDPRGWCASLHQVGLRDSQAGDHPAGDATGLPVGTLGASRPGLCQPAP